MEANDSPMDQDNSHVSSIDLTSHKLTTDEALKCLTGDYNVIVPTASAQVCNNLDEYLYKSTANARKTPNRSSDASLESRRRSSRGSQEPFAVPLVRNFEKILKSAESRKLPSQGSNSDPEQQASRPKRTKPDVFSRAESLETNSGPFSHLKSRMGKTVKVIIRRRRKVPFISRIIEYKGRLIIFDKHMNLHLGDVIESFTYLKQGKTFKRARHRESIVLRGDNIILIA